MPAVGRRRVPRATDAAIEGGLRAPGRAPAVVRLRRCVRIWSITDACVMHATIRIGPAQGGHTSGSTSKICRSNACLDYQRTALVNLPCTKIQCDEIWSFVGAKEKNTPKELRGTGERGDCWTWTAIFADSKLIPVWHVGLRDAITAREFMNDVVDRLANRVQLTADEGPTGDSQDPGDWRRASRITSGRSKKSSRCCPKRETDPIPTICVPCADTYYAIVSIRRLISRQPVSSNYCLKCLSVKSLQGQFGPRATSLG